MSVPLDMCTELIETYELRIVEKSVALGEDTNYTRILSPLKTRKRFSRTQISNIPIYITRNLASRSHSTFKIVAVVDLEKTFATRSHFIRSLKIRGDFLVSPDTLDHCLLVRLDIFPKVIPQI